MSRYPLVTKADGEQEPFDPDKLTLSLKRAGASSDIQNKIVNHLTHEIEDGTTTEEIYRHAFTLLRTQEKRPIAARYSVKRAVFALGPSGFPFEKFFAEVLKGHGWKTATGVAATGRCAPHEVDVMATKDGRRVGIEAKFHNAAGAKTDVRDALYVHARFEDLKASPDASDQVDEGWLVTNTRFTRSAIRYAHCVGLTLVGWDYPRDHGMLDLIEQAQVHPVTALTTLSEEEKRSLLDRNFVLCRSIGTGSHVLRDHGVAPARIPEVLDEARQLCGLA
jgi:hypothetical protein